MFLTYRASTAVDAVVARALKRKPLFNITAADGVRHEVWRVDAQDNQSIVDAFAALRALYIADGHHRAASAARARRELDKNKTVLSASAALVDSSAASESDRVLAVAFPDNQMQVLPYNRVVKDLHGLTAAEFLASLKRRLTVRDGGPATPARKGDIAIYLAGRWHTLVMPAAAVSLDVDLLQTSILEPILGIDDVRIDKRIDFVGGIRGTGELEMLVDSGVFAVAFSLFPVSVDDLMRIADAGGIMPPKSTWFEPKLRDGLLSHVI